MELNKTIQDLKMEVETIKKSRRETSLEIEILGKKSGTNTCLHRSYGQNTDCIEVTDSTQAIL